MVGFSPQKKLRHKSSLLRTNQAPRLLPFLIMTLKRNLKTTNSSPTNPPSVPLQNRTYLCLISLPLIPCESSTWHVIQPSLSFPSPPLPFLSLLSPNNHNLDPPHPPSLSSPGRNNNLRTKVTPPPLMLSRCITFPTPTPMPGIITLISALTYIPQMVSAQASTR